MTPRRRKGGRPAPPVRKTSRRWRVPPPLTHGPEPLEGGTILEELPTPVGGLLWETTRDLSMWTATPAEERGELFSAEAAEKRERKVAEIGPPPQLGGALGALSVVLTDATGADPEDLAAACRSVAAWAESEGHLGIALAYTQTIALLREADPRVAHEVGVLARRRGEVARAETWFRRAVMLARQNGDWTSYSLAFVALGDLYLERGNHAVARKLHVRAKRAAHRHSLHPIEGMALHGLFLMASASGDGAEADELADAALSAYGTRNPRVLELAADAARDWLERGHPEHALRVFQALLPHVNGSPRRIDVLAGTARAAAETGDAEAFRKAAGEVREMADQRESGAAAEKAIAEVEEAEKVLKRGRASGSSRDAARDGAAPSALAARFLDRLD